MPRGVQNTPTFCNTVAEFTEELVECPYNISHQLRPDRLGRHLIICRKECLSSSTNPGYKRALAIKVCPYNSLHHINRSDLEHHLTLCKSAALCRQEKGLLENNKKIEQISKPLMQDEKRAATVSDEEDWEKEVEGLNLCSYNPMNKVVRENIPVNASNGLINKSGRRDIRTLQRLGDKDGLDQMLNGFTEGPSLGESHVPVGMTLSPGKKKKKKKKRQQA